MAVLQEGDFELDGFLFSANRDRPVYVRNFSIGGASSRTQDAPNPVGDQVLFGRDYLAPGQWGFGLRVREDTMAKSLEVFGGLATKWAADTTRVTPGAMSVLRYCIGGRTRRIYGRSRGLTPNPENLWVARMMDADVIFDPESPMYFEDAESVLQLQMVPGNARGLVTPLVTPLTTVAGGTRQGVITTEGDYPTPFRVTFKGPVTDPYVVVSGQKLQLLTTIAYDQTITVDTRLLTVTRSGGANMAGSVSRRTRLSEARLKPGPSEVIFGGTDLSGTATCTVSWRPAYHSL